MSDKLVVDSDREFVHRIRWICDGEEGGALGETVFQRDALSADRDTAESAAAYFAALEHGPERDSLGFYWGNLAQAVKALRACRLAIRTLDRPWPEWARTAHNAGWKPPKGWKP